MIERSRPALSLGAPCRLLSIPRSSIPRSASCCAARDETGMNLALMRLIDRQFPETPCYGVQQMPACSR